MADSIKITGLRPLADALSEFKKSTERAVLKRTATKALQPFVERAKQLVPVHEGHLRESIVIGAPLTGKGKVAERAEPKGGVRVYAGTANRNGVPREFGTFRSAAKPFMRPAWDSTSEGMIKTIQDELAADIDRTAARVAARAKRS